MLLPSGKRVDASTPIVFGSNFTWGEATAKCTRPVTDLIVKGKLIISAGEIEHKIINTAIELDHVRKVLGDRPIYVNSWYRPQHINQKVGGSSQSRHQFGDAVDIRSDYLSPAQMYKLLDSIHVYGGLSRYFSFVHIDWRGELARW
jgi:zinc D-Ala-D-Ala carboxypeptidase